MAGLLKRDIVIFAILQCLTERNGVLDNTWLCIGAHTMGVSGCVLEQERCVLLQRTTAVIEIMNLHLHVFLVA